MKVIHESESTLADGTRLKITISTEEGKTISDDDKAFIRRILPLSAGLMLDAVDSEQPQPKTESLNP